MFRLALAWGCSVRELGLRLSAAELTEWMGFALIEPFGEARADDRARGMMAVMASTGGAKNVRPADFLKNWEPPAAISEADQVLEMMARFKTAAVLFPGDEEEG